MANADYYKVLGVAETASADEIKKAYRKAAKKFHPDATGGDKFKESKFKEITEANEVLGDEKKRAAYDASRRNPFGGGGQPFGGGQPGQGGVEFDMSDIFGARGAQTRGAGGGFGGFSDIFDMFGGQQGGGRKEPRRGQDVVSRLEIELPEAALGADKAVVVDGKRLSIKIPAGVTSGKTIRLAGQGEPGPRGGQSGDLLIELHEKPNAHFRRRASGAGTPSADIEVDVPVSVDVAVLGGKAEAMTLEGKPVTVTIPAGTSSGKKLRLKEKGAYIAPNGKRGDLYAVISIQVPAQLTDRARELMIEFAKVVAEQ